MALKMAAKKVAPVVEVEVSPVIEPVVIPKVLQPGLTDVQTLTAEYIELWRKFDYFEVKQLVKRMDEIRKQLVTVANETMDEKKPAVFSCPAGEVEFSERGKVSEVPNPLALIQELLGKFGPDVTASVINIAITPLRKVLSEFELKKHLKEEPGIRTIRAVRPVK
jgi:hypothetical protein